MLVDRITGAFLFRREVYADVEKDQSFTQTAWLIVVVVAFLNQLGSNSAHVSSGIVDWIVSTVLGTILMIGAFAVGVLIVNFVGQKVFNADVSFDELVRTLGLAYVWNIIAVIGILSALTPIFACVLGPIVIISGLAGLAAWLIAAKEALDLDWVQTIITVILGWVVRLVATMLVGLILGFLGITTAFLGGLF
ncbi:MAG: hypothetical protein MUO76_17295 [Anaerolineaceae bacterium]|nr:hypothetical protein [Anaerolineaceae bacterium]